MYITMSIPPRVVMTEQFLHFFDQINAALVSKRTFFQKCKNLTGCCGEMKITWKLHWIWGHKIFFDLDNIFGLILKQIWDSSLFFFFFALRCVMCHDVLKIGFAL